MYPECNLRFRYSAHSKHVMRQRWKKVCGRSHSLQTGYLFNRLYHDLPKHDRFEDVSTKFYRKFGLLEGRKSTENSTVAHRTCRETLRSATKRHESTMKVMKRREELIGFAPFLSGTPLLFLRTRKALLDKCDVQHIYEAVLRDAGLYRVKDLHRSMGIGTFKDLIV